MIVEHLDVQNVRNIESARLDLQPGFNVLVGPNGAGKTAVLEAIHLLIRGRSFRTARTTGLLRRGEKRMAVGAACRDRQVGAVRLSYSRESSGQTELRRDGRAVRRSSEVAGLLPIQLLLPDLSELVFGGPSGRRQWLDWGTFHVKHDHMAQLAAYLRVLRHRNALLRSGELQTLATWTDQLAEIGEAVSQARLSYFRGIEPAIEAALQALSAGFSVSLGYLRGWGEGGLSEALRAELEQDARAGATRSGPHRADVAIRCGTEAAATTLSRGQGKMVASALRLAQAQDLMASGRRSLFLIDDVGAELDREHSQRFYQVLDDMDCQIFATSAQPAIDEMLPPTTRARTFHVKQGAIAVVGA